MPTRNSAAWSSPSSWSGRPRSPRPRVPASAPAVKVTSAHDPNDYACYQRQLGTPSEIGIINILNPDGTLNAEAGAYEGLTIQKARQRVVEDLDRVAVRGDRELQRLRPQIGQHRAELADLPVLSPLRRQPPSLDIGGVRAAHD